LRSAILLCRTVRHAIRCRHAGSITVLATRTGPVLANRILPSTVVLSAVLVAADRAVLVDPGPGRLEASRHAPGETGPVPALAIAAILLSIGAITALAQAALIQAALTRPTRTRTRLASAALARSGLTRAYLTSPSLPWTGITRAQLPAATLARTELT
jgi:hypothetical protein